MAVCSVGMAVVCSLVAVHARSPQCSLVTVLARHCARSSQCSLARRSACSSQGQGNIHITLPNRTRAAVLFDIDMSTIGAELGALRGSECQSMDGDAQIAPGHWGRWRIRDGAGRQDRPPSVANLIGPAHPAHRRLAALPHLPLVVPLCRAASAATR